MNRVYVVGIGPGAGKQMTEEAREVLNACDTIIGYTVYVDLVKEQFPEKEFLTTPMKQEVKRCKMAFEEAMKGKKVAMICSGDAGVYGMAGLMYEVGVEFPKAELEVVPGSRRQSACSRAWSSVIHDFAVISLSDLLTPWEKIEKRVRAAAMADFVICLYNPSSRKRHDYLEKACNMMLEYKAEDTNLRNCQTDRKRRAGEPDPYIKGIKKTQRWICYQRYLSEMNRHRKWMVTW